MALFENTNFPGAPYLIAGILSIWSLLHTYELPKEPQIAHRKFRQSPEDFESMSFLNQDSDVDSISEL